MVLIRRYANRKLYDTSRRRYSSLREIGEMVLTGTEIRVVDHDSHEDVTAATLHRVLAAQPPAVRTTSEEAPNISDDAEIARLIAALQASGGLEPMEATRLLLLWSAIGKPWVGPSALFTRTDCLRLVETVDNLNREVCRFLSRRAGAEVLQS